MLWLLSILSGTIIYTDCNRPELLGYFNHLEPNNIYVCQNNRDEEITRLEVILHEIGHMYQYKRTGYTDEIFADNFYRCWTDNRCMPKLRTLISKNK